MKITSFKKHCFKKHWVTECPHCYEIITSLSADFLYKHINNHFKHNDKCRKANNELPNEVVE